MPKSKNPILPRVDHITLTVKDFEKSKQIYTELFVNYLSGGLVIDEVDFCGFEFDNGFRLFISEENPEFKNSKFNRYQVGLHHFALELANKQEIDDVYQKLLELKVKILDAPAFYPQYEEGYYAVYWEDLNGFKMEFMCVEKS